jgi:hypothetical protein
MRPFRLVYLVVGICLTGMAGYGTYLTSRALAESLASAHWPSTPGRIISAHSRFVVGRYNSTGPDIRYTYSVGGRGFAGSRVDVVTYSSNTSYASDALAQFREGAKVPVYFDPAHPQRSALRRGANWVAYVLPVLSLILTLFGLALIRLSIRFYRESAPA